MSGNLLGTLGLGNVEADPNVLPDGKWPGVVFKSEYVYSKPKNTVYHVITYRITDGERKGAERSEFFTIGIDPIYDDGNTLVGVTPTMSETQKPWYKKRLMDLGIAEASLNDGSADITAIVGKLVTFGTKKNGEFINVSFVELRDGNTQSQGSPATATAPATDTSRVPAAKDVSVPDF